LKYAWDGHFSANPHGGRARCPSLRRTPAPKRVAFAFPFGRAFVEDLAHAIHAHARAREHWVFTRFPERLSPSLDWLKAWDGDGAFVIISTREDARLARALPFPVVNLTAYFPDPGVPTVTMDHAEIGRLAARHLLDRRFRHFGFYGSGELWFSQLRRQGFVETVRRGRGVCEVLEANSNITSGRTWMRQQLKLEQWLRSLRPPVGILASTDLRANLLLETCQQIGRRVPDEIAVIGVDNDPVICGYSQPPLSSVARDDHRAGEVAAALLAELMAGRSARPGAGPGRARRRGRAPVHGDHGGGRSRAGRPGAARPRAHVAERFGVERLLAVTRWSRRSLETRFRRQLGLTPGAFVTGLRLKHAEKMLAANPKLPLTSVAAACGFSDLRHFRMVFRRLNGVSPTAHRRKLRRRLTPPLPAP
jgi:LacI family transcriptional regulator